MNATERKIQNDVLAGIVEETQNRNLVACLEDWWKRHKDSGYEWQQISDWCHGAGRTFEACGFQEWETFYFLSDIAQKRALMAYAAQERQAQRWYEEQERQA